MPLTGTTPQLTSDGGSTMKRALLLLSVTALFAVGCTARPIGGDTGWKVYGPSGTQGVAGPAGPTGPAGPSGVAGRQGPAGPAGDTGAGGAQGSQGMTGAQGSQGSAGAGLRWTTFRDFQFDFDQSFVRQNETNKVSDIAAYLQENPSHTVGIDGYTDPRGSNKYNQALSQRRVDAVKSALVNAGVPADKILTGAFGEQRSNCRDETEACWQHNRRVEVLIGIKTASK
jgi:outer membrane protein OmpA-like peptidoglycan-associated protein